MPSQDPHLRHLLKQPTKMGLDRKLDRLWTDWEIMTLLGQLRCSVPTASLPAACFTTCIVYVYHRADAPMDNKTGFKINK